VKSKIRTMADKNLRKFILDHPAYKS